MGKIILVCVESSCLELLSKQCRVLMLSPPPHRVPIPSSGMVGGGKGCAQAEPAILPSSVACRSHCS